MQIRRSLAIIFVLKSTKNDVISTGNLNAKEMVNLARSHDLACGWKCGISIYLIIDWVSKQQSVVLYFSLVFGYMIFNLEINFSVALKWF